MSARNMAKRTAAGTLALAVCLGGGALALAGAAQADANFKFDTRIAGDDRYQTAIEASKAAFPTGTKTDNVVLVNGFATVDGLTASYLAGVANAPILYVSDKGADDATKAEIKRLGAKNVWLVGGDKVIPTSVEAAIKGDGYTVTRVNGSDRYETAKLVAEAGAKIAGKQPSKVFVASGTSFADALAVSPIAYAKGYAIALTEKDSTSDFTKKELGNIGTDAKILVGGTAVVSDKVKADLSITTRVAGDDRAVTANLVSDWAKASEGFSKANAALVGGTNGNGADSLVAAAPAGKALTTLHFAGWDATNVYLKDHAAELTGKGWVFGGKAAVPGDQVDKAQAAAQMVAALNSIKVTPSDTVAVTVADETGDKATADDRVYSATGLDKSLKYRVTLVKSTSIKVAADGSVTFLEDGTTGLVDPGTLQSDITAVNGVPTGAPGTHVQSVGAISANDGSLTFRVDGKGYETLVPVVYVDGGTSTRLEIDSKKMSKEVFGLGGMLVVLPVEETAGTTVSAATVKEVFKDGSFIAEKAGTTKFYKIDSNDSFKVDAAQATIDGFKDRLTVNDTITVTDYQSNSSLKSTFELTNVLPAALATSSITPGERSVVLTFATADVAEGATVNVYYANDTTTANAAAPVYSTSFTKKTFTADDDATTTGFQVTLSGLTPAQALQLYTSQTVSGDESTKTGAETATVADAVPAFSAVTPNDVNDGVGSTNEVVVTFDQEVSVLDATKFTVNPTAQTSFVFTGVTAKKANTSGTKWIVTLDKTMQDAATSIGYDFKVAAGAVADTSNQKNAAATSTFNY